MEVEQTYRPIDICRAFGIQKHKLKELVRTGQITPHRYFSGLTYFSDEHIIQLCGGDVEYAKEMKKRISLNKYYREVKM